VSTVKVLRAGYENIVYVFGSLKNNVGYMIIYETYSKILFTSEIQFQMIIVGWIKIWIACSIRIFIPI